jgi:hypothetical protein
VGIIYNENTNSGLPYQDSLLHIRSFFDFSGVQAQRHTGGNFELLVNISTIKSYQIHSKLLTLSFVKYP